MAIVDARLIASFRNYYFISHCHEHDFRGDINSSLESFIYCTTSKMLISSWRFSIDACKHVSFGSIVIMFKASMTDQRLIYGPMSNFDFIEIFFVIIIKSMPFPIRMICLIRVETSDCVCSMISSIIIYLAELKYKRIVDFI